MVVLPLGLWTLSALVVGYFVWQAESGNRGLEAKKALKIRTDAPPIKVAPAPAVVPAA